MTDAFIEYLMGQQLSRIHLREFDVHHTEIYSQINQSIDT